jgi:hypothetical protein
MAKTMENINFKHVFLKTKILHLQTFFKNRAALVSFFARVALLQNQTKIRNYLGQKEFADRISKIQINVDVGFVILNKRSICKYTHAFEPINYKFVQMGFLLQHILQIRYLFVKFGCTPLIFPCTKLFIRFI